MKKWYFSSLLMIGLVLSSCNNVNVANSETAHQNAQTPIREYSVQSVVWQQNAAEYRALCYQAFNLAKLRLDYFLENLEDTQKKPALISDIDETLLDNSPYNAKMIERDVDYNQEEWKEWTDLAEAKAIPGAVEFFNYAKSRGVEIFYVTNRHISEKETTIKNMEVAGFPSASTENLFLRDETSSKSSRFEKVQEYHNVLLYLGDNLSDFKSDEFRINSSEKRNHLVDKLKDDFGNKFIVLPNPMYGDWETRGIYEGSYEWTDAQKDSLRRSKLKMY